MGTPGGCKPFNPQFSGGKKRCFCAPDGAGNVGRRGPAAVVGSGIFWERTGGEARLVDLPRGARLCRSDQPQRAPNCRGLRFFHARHSWRSRSG